MNAPVNNVHVNVVMATFFSPLLFLVLTVAFAHWGLYAHLLWHHFKNSSAFLSCGRSKLYSISSRNQSEVFWGIASFHKETNTRTWSELAEDISSSHPNTCIMFLSLRVSSSPQQKNNVLECVLRHERPYTESPESSYLRPWPQTFTWGPAPVSSQTDDRHICKKVLWHTCSRLFYLWAFQMTLH